MPKTSRVSTVVLSLITVFGAACGDDASGTGGAGGDASTSSSAATTSSGSPTSTTSSGDVASSSSGGDQGGGDAGGGAQGGGDTGGADAGGGGAGGSLEPDCTADEPPDAPCEEEEHVGLTCQVTVEGGGCPDTAVTWRCTNFEGGPFWNQSIDTGCYCSVENEEGACTALPGCVWAVAPGDTCDDFTFDGVPIDEAGCYREDCGDPGAGLVGIVDEACQDDLCSAFPPD